MRQKDSEHVHSERGFTLLLAALVSSVVLALGASIYELAHKQVTLSSMGRDSQFAFYAADTIAECALYWDFRFSYFATTTPAGVTPVCDTIGLGPFTVTPSQSQPYTLTSGQSYTIASAPINLLQATSSQKTFCAQVFVTKSIDPATGSTRTLIHAEGYNVNCNSIQVAAQALQRTAEWSY